ncbi:MAG: hypothetical protein IT361_13955 [Gemmatimonadaceae bacterium]|nr:hypothetical protein [Gemmatimonadaceae bacterium]
MAVLACFALPGLTSAQPVRLARPSPNDAWTAHAAAVLALQGLDTSSFIDSAIAARAGAFLTRAVQEIAGLPRAMPEGNWWALTLIPDDGLIDVLQSRRGAQLQRKFLPQWIVRPGGMTGLDTLLNAHRPDSVILRRGIGGSDRTTWSLRVTYRYAMNLPAILERYLAVPGMRAGFISPDDGLQSGSLWTLSLIDDRWRLSLREGLGECRVQCAEEREWTVTEAPDGSPRLLFISPPRPR